MRKLFVLLIWFLIFSVPSFPQSAIGGWITHFSYNKALKVLNTTTGVACSGENGFFTFNSNSKELVKFDKTTGLSESAISAWTNVPTSDAVVVAYDNSMIDLIKENQVIPIPDLFNKVMLGSKKVNAIYVYGEKAYFACDFGVMVLDLQKREMKETYFLQNASGGSLFVNDLVVWENALWIATKEGLFKGDFSENLMDMNSWEPVEDVLFHQKDLSNICIWKDKIVVGGKVSGKTHKVWIKQSDEWEDLYLGSALKAVRGGEDFLLVGFERMVVAFDQDLKLVKKWDNFPDGSPMALNDAEVTSMGEIFVADNQNGLVQLGETEMNEYLPQGPSSNSAYDLKVAPGKVIIVPGGRKRTTAFLNLPGQVNIFDSKQGVWTTLTKDNTPGLEISHRDFLKVAIDPANPDHFFVGSWQNGAFEFQLDQVEIFYNESNSTLQSVFPGNPRYLRVEGVSFDQAGNVWFSNTEVPNVLSVKTPEGDWQSFSFDDYSGRGFVLGDILCRPSGDLWVLYVRAGFTGILAYDPGTDVLISDDDKHKAFKIRDENEELLADIPLCIAQDQDGYVWVGTDKGIVVYYNPENVFEENRPFYASRIKVPRKDGSGLADYLLEKETVTCIVVDPGNRKWIGTLNSGVFLISPDGTEMLNHFDITNSPLPSNSITTIGVDSQSGQVYVGTSKGLVSYRAEATAGDNDFKKVYAFPNPVREDYEGVITITGLMDDTDVRITDIAGNLVFQTHSIGGQAIWDGKNGYGEHVKTGIYLVFCAAQQGQKSTVTKILVIGR